MDALPGSDRELLEFEGEWRRHSGAKEAAIRETFGLSSTRYYQRLNRVIGNPAALAAEPLLVKALLRARARRTRDRSARALSTA